MNQYIYSTFFCVLLFCSCKERATKKVVIQKLEIFKQVDRQVNMDSVNLENYLVEVYRILLEEDSLKSDVKIKELYRKEREGAREYFNESLHYSPDSTFKIFTIHYESCGAYCGGNEWHSWIHYNLKGKQVVDKILINEIESIHKIDSLSYLVIENFGIRETGVLSSVYGRAVLLRFLNNRLIIDCTQVTDSTSSDCSFFTLRQTNLIQSDTLPFIRYDSIKKMVHYGFGRNDGYPEPSENDTFFFGSYKFKKGSFSKLKEKKVIQKSQGWEQ